VRASRDAAAVERTLAALGDAAGRRETGDTSVQLMPLIIDAVRARASVGEIADTLASKWGVYRPAV
jgi:methylmalonyl-CoA mutase N-terminal domain/subunit